MATRGEIWLANLSPTQGHEQHGSRPVLVVSADAFNRGRSGLIVVVPLTTTHRGVPLHVRIDPPEGGLSHASYAMCDAVRSISTDRLTQQRPWGPPITAATMAVVEDRLRVLLDL